MTTNPVETVSKPLVTAGRVQHVVDCPRCGGAHRHLDLGVRRGPCGARYAVVATREERP